MSERSGITDRGRLHVLLGCARGGKSTYANSFVNFLDPDSQNIVSSALWNGESFFPSYARPRVVVAGDDLRLALHGMEYSKPAEGFVCALMDVCIRALLARGFDVIVDETCTSESTLARYIQLDDDPVFIWIDTPVEVCIERAKAHGQDSLIEPIKRMGEQLTALKKDFPNILERLRSAKREGRLWGSLKS